MKANSKILSILRDIYPQIDQLPTDEFNKISTKINDVADDIVEHSIKNAQDKILENNGMQFVAEASFFNKDPIKRTKNGKTKITFVFDDKDASIMKSMEELFFGNKKELYLIKSQKPLMNERDSLFQKAPLDYLLEKDDTTK